MTTNAEGLDVDESGQLIICPLVGWAMFTTYGGTGIVIRLEYRSSEDQETPSSVQLGLTVEGARSLAQGLLKKVDQAMQPPPSGQAIS